LTAQIWPRLGPSIGGTVVTVTGDVYLASTTCRFGVVDATATTVTSSTLLSCVAPAQAAGAVNLELTSNGQQFTADRVQFLYYSTLFVFVRVSFVILTPVCA
jgi:hypothetical protein